MQDNRVNLNRLILKYFMSYNVTALKPDSILIKALALLLILNAYALPVDAFDGKSFKSKSSSEIVSNSTTIGDELTPDLSNWLQSPNGGEVYFRGSSIVVNINASVYNTNQAISIELYYGTTKIAGPDTGGMTNRSISTTGLPAGSNYKIRIYVANFPDQEDWSNNTFSLVTSGYAGPCAAPMGSDVKGCTLGSELYLSVSNTETDSHICGKTISHKWYTSASGTNTVAAAVEPTGTCAAYSTSVRVTSASSYWVSSVIDGCESERILITATYLNQNIDVPANGIASRCTPGSIALSATPSANGNSIRWYTNQAATPGTTDIPFKTGVSVSITDPDPTNVKTYYASSYNTNYGCESTRVPVIAIITTLPEIPANKNFIFCVLEEKEVSAVPSGYIVNYNWYDNAGTFLKRGLKYTLPIDDGMPTQISNLQLESISKDNCPSTSRASISIQLTQDCDDQLNSVESITYDPRDNTNILGQSMSYFDLAGKPLQTQSKSFENPINPDVPLIFASQSLQDNLGRNVISTLSAPTFKSDFQYDHFFVRSSSTERYEAEDFDSETTKNNPLSVNKDVKGTLGWYYSANNDVEKNVPVTDYPYSRTDFYDDGNGEVRKSASAGDQFRLGKGHEMLSGTFPVYKELDDYISKRHFSNSSLATLAQNGVQNVVRDQNGKYGISITDKSGKVVMNAHSGTSSASVLTVQNIINSTNISSSDTYRMMTYFYILESQVVTLTGINYVVEDIVNNVKKAVGQTFADPSNGNKWPAGFYRVLLPEPQTNGTYSPYSNFTLTYSNTFSDVSYQFYDDAGRLKTSLSPNGFQQLKQLGIDIATTAVDKTTYTYNHQGWLLSMTEPDAGTTKYVYRKDGMIRFSQSAKQFANESQPVGGGRFSYTNYDDLGRPVESGEYIGTLHFSDLSNNLEFEDQINFGSAEKKDWVITHYDFPYGDGLPADQNQISSLSLGEQQFLRGAVSWTENANAKTIYNYDEFGHVIWMVKLPVSFPRKFVVKYNYDLLGNVLDVSNLVYQGSALTNQFFHHYEYDKNQRLSKAFTSVEPDGEKKLRATYEYYLHGPLKRIVLGDKLQGIDFVYNINGWLTQINHPDTNQDPGQDGSGNGVRKDVFGMVLDYYESDLNNLFTASTGSVHDPARRHRLPFANETVVASNQQPLIRFESPAIYKNETLVPFKSYSAQSPAYKNMLQSKKEN